MERERTQRTRAGWRDVLTIIVVIAALLTPMRAWTQEPVGAAAEAAAFRQVAMSIPLGSRVKVHTTAGRRLTATLMQITETGVIVKREGRLPEPAVEIAFGELMVLRQDTSKGSNIAKFIGFGLAAGAAAMLTLIGFALALD